MADPLALGPIERELERFESRRPHGEFDVIGDARRKTLVADEREGGPIHHPSHYNSHPSGIETIDVIEEMTFNVGTAVKYLWRVGLKESEAPDQELAKAAWYIQRERERLRKRAERK